MKKEFSAGLIVYRETQQGPKFLLLYHGGRYWNFPKGHIEYKRAEKPVITTSFESDEAAQGEEWSVRETSKEAALRETFEETGIKPEKLDIKKGFRAVERFNFFRNREHIFKIVIFYIAETKETEIEIPAEREGVEPFNGFGWFLYKDARYILAPYKDSQKLLRSAYEFIRPKTEDAGVKERAQATPRYGERRREDGRPRPERRHHRPYDRRREDGRSQSGGERDKEKAHYMQRSTDASSGDSYDIV